MNRTHVINGIARRHTTPDKAQELVNNIERYGTKLIDVDFAGDRILGYKYNNVYFCIRKHYGEINRLEEQNKKPKYFNDWKKISKI